MIMTLILVLVTLLCAYGIRQTKKQGNVFGFAFSALATLAFGLSTVLSLII